jgi:hypothetical protein
LKTTLKKAVSQIDQYLNYPTKSRSTGIAPLCPAVKNIQRIVKNALWHNEKISVTASGTSDIPVGRVQ